MVVGRCKEFVCFDNNESKLDDDDNIIFSGRFLSVDSHTTIKHTIKKCVATCNGYLKKGINFEAAIIYENQCFCKTQKPGAASSEDVSKRFKKLDCKLSPCNALNQTCSFQAYSFVNLTEGIRNLTFTSKDFKSGNISKLPLIVYKG